MVAPCWEGSRGTRGHHQPCAGCRSPVLAPQYSTFLPLVPRAPTQRCHHPSGLDKEAEGKQRRDQGEPGGRHSSSVGWYFGALPSFLLTTPPWLCQAQPSYSQDLFIERGFLKTPGSEAGFWPGGDAEKDTEAQDSQKFNLAKYRARELLVLYTSELHVGCSARTPTSPGPLSCCKVLRRAPRSPSMLRLVVIARCRGL